MQVDLIARTAISYDGYRAMQEAGWTSEEQPTSSDALAEFAGRLCYLSWNRPNPKTATNQGYLDNILEHKHYSTIEHASVSLLFRGVSRSLTHELVRHRHFSYSQVSQRYCDQSKTPTTFHPLFHNLSLATQDALLSLEGDSKWLYELIESELIAQGKTKKEARGAARQVLPEGTETAILVSGNLRSWMEFVDTRYSIYADEEIRSLAAMVLQELKFVAPNVFQHFDLKDFSTQQGVTK